MWEKIPHHDPCCAAHRDDVCDCGLEELRARIAELGQEHDEDQGVIRVWRGRTERAEAQRDRMRGTLESTMLALNELANAMAQASADCSLTPGCWDPSGTITVARYEAEDALDAARAALKEMDA